MSELAVCDSHRRQCSVWVQCAGVVRVQCGCRWWVLWVCEVSQVSLVLPASLVLSVSQAFPPDALVASLCSPTIHSVTHSSPVFVQNMVGGRGGGLFRNACRHNNGTYESVSQFKEMYLVYY